MKGKKNDDKKKKSASKKDKGDKTAVKGRPTCKRDLDEEKKVKHTKPKHKYIQLWVDKMENFHIILTADGGGM
jgi:hypothetical protein